MSLTRRDFLGTSALALLSGALPAHLVADRRAAGGLRELRRGVGVFTARGGTIGWLIDPGGAVVVDSQFPDTAATCLAELERGPAAPIAALVNSHHHADHTAGNGVFREVSRRIVAHERVPQLQRGVAEARGNLDAQTYADTTFADEWVLEVGDETVRARHYGPAHTAGDCTIYFEAANVVHMGDLVFHHAYPFIDRAGGASVQGWIETLEAVAGEHSTDAIFVFGHGLARAGITGTREDVLLQRDLLTALLDTARRAAAAGKSREEAAALDRLPDFPDHAPLVESLTLAVALGAAYDEVTGRR